jgi:hypothetical protein
MRNVLYGSNIASPFSACTKFRSPSSTMRPLIRSVSIFLSSSYYARWPPLPMRELKHSMSLFITPSLTVSAVCMDFTKRLVWILESQNRFAISMIEPSHHGGG